MSRKIRLDLHLLTKGLVTSRQQAQKLIRAGKVKTLVGEILDKPGLLVDHSLAIDVTFPSRFVSRGGEKLFAALEQFDVRIQKRVCLDCGISTGGFTDCLLKNDASFVYGVDVGYGQTSWSLRTDPRVSLRERTNIRYLTPDQLYGDSEKKATLAVADLSFISLKLVLSSINQLLLNENKEMILLIKPQFEVGKERVGKGGVVRDVDSHIDAITGVIDSAQALGFYLHGIIASPLKGPAGNHEYLGWLRLNSNMPKLPLISDVVKKTLA